MARAQVQNQIFIYVVSLVVISLIMLYGYNALKKMNEQSDQVSYIQFKADLENEIKKMGYEYGSVEKKSFTVPAKMIEVCFVDLDYAVSIDWVAVNAVEGNHPVITDSVGSGVQKNVFLVKKTAEDSIYVGDIAVDDPYVKCFPVISNRITVRLEGLGKQVKVSEW